MAKQLPAKTYQDLSAAIASLDGLDVDELTAVVAQEHGAIPQIETDYKAIRLRRLCSAMRLSGALCRIKDELPHGEWGQWLSANNWSERRAQEYMQLARKFNEEASNPRISAGLNDGDVTCVAELKRLLGCGAKQKPKREDPINAEFTVTPNTTPSAPASPSDRVRGASQGTVDGPASSGAGAEGAPEAGAPEADRGDAYEGPDPCATKGCGAVCAPEAKWCGPCLGRLAAEREAKVAAKGEVPGPTEQREDDEPGEFGAEELAAAAVLFAERVTKAVAALDSMLADIRALAAKAKPLAPANPVAAMGATAPAKDRFLQLGQTMTANTVHSVGLMAREAMTAKGHMGRLVVAAREAGLA